jgi:pimeloyl-ACP methyl ester carboxylesterase
MNGKPVSAKTLGELARNLPSNQSVSFDVRRGNQTITLKADMVEKPKDPGTEMYEVSYSHIVSNGKRMRTIITTPRKPGGKRPGFFFIQGFSPNSYDFTLSTSIGDVKTIDGPLLHQFASEGFVTIRVEKPGVGDSEGGPFADLDYITELDIYRQTLKQLKEHGGVDKDNIFIFGHSMGGHGALTLALRHPELLEHGSLAALRHSHAASLREERGVGASEQAVAAVAVATATAAEMIAQVQVEEEEGVEATSGAHHCGSSGTGLRRQRSSGSSARRERADAPAGTLWNGAALSAARAETAADPEWTVVPAEALGAEPMGAAEGWSLLERAPAPSRTCYTGSALSYVILQLEAPRLLEAHFASDAGGSADLAALAAVKDLSAQLDALA